jgi:hypothetical protein
MDCGKSAVVTAAKESMQRMRPDWSQTAAAVTFFGNVIFVKSSTALNVNKMIMICHVNHSITLYNEPPRRKIWNCPKKNNNWWSLSWMRWCQKDCFSAKHLLLAILVVVGKFEIIANRSEFGYCFSSVEIVPIWFCVQANCSRYGCADAKNDECEMHKCLKRGQRTFQNCEIYRTCMACNEDIKARRYLDNSRSEESDESSY